MRWLALQIVIVCSVVWLVDDPSLTLGAVVYGAILALIVTGLISKFLDWRRFGSWRSAPHQSDKPQGDGVSLGRIDRHLGDSPKISNRPRIGQNVR